LVWIVARTRPNGESVAKHFATLQGAQCYLPRYRVPRSHNARVLFPSYLFVLIDQSWHYLTRTIGIVRVLVNENGPLVCPDKEIERLKRREDIEGLICAPRQWIAGQKVRIENEIFGNIDGRYNCWVGKGRSKVFLEMMGQAVQLEVDDWELKAA